MDELVVAAVRRLKSGIDVEDAARAVSEQLRPRLVRYFQYRRFAAPDAEDLAQETLRRLFKGLDGLENVECFMGWAFRIAQNVALTARAAAASAPSADSLDGPSHDDILDTATPSPLRAMLSAQELQRVWTAVEALPPQQRQCLLLRARHDMSYEEIATVLRLSARTVRNHLREARLRLRRKLGD